MKMYVVWRLQNGDDVAFCYVMRTSGEATWVRRLAGSEAEDVEQLWNFVWPLTRASDAGGLDKLPVLVKVKNQPTFGVKRTPRNLGDHATYKTASLQACVSALQRYTRG